MSGLQVDGDFGQKDRDRKFSVVKPTTLNLENQSGEACPNHIIIFWFQGLSNLHWIAFYQSLQSKYTPLFCFMQGLQFNVLQWLIKCWTVPAIDERAYLCEAYGDCIDFKRAILWKEATNTDIEEPVFIGLNIAWLAIFDIKASKGNGYDSKRRDLGKRLPLRPNGTFWQ